MATERHFEAKPPDEQEWMLQNTWCKTCNEADLGMERPTGFEKGGIVVVEGLCKKCGATIRSEVIRKFDSGS